MDPSLETSILQAFNECQQWTQIFVVDDSCSTVDLSCASTKVSPRTPHNVKNNHRCIRIAPSIDLTLQCLQAMIPLKPLCSWFKTPFMVQSFLSSRDPGTIALYCGVLTSASKRRHKKTPTRLRRKTILRMGYSPSILRGKARGLNHHLMQWRGNRKRKR